MHFLFPTAWYRRSIVISSTSRISNSSLQAILFHITSSTAFRFLKPPSPLRENKKPSQMWNSNNAACKMTRSPEDSSFHCNDLPVLAQPVSCWPPVESRGSRGTFSEHRTFYHHIDSPFQLFNQWLYFMFIFPCIISKCI